MPATAKQYRESIRRKYLLAGIVPIKAVYDAGMNCLICGESGNCPGWHEPPQSLPGVATVAPVVQMNIFDVIDNVQHDRP